MNDIRLLKLECSAEIAETEIIVGVSSIISEASDGVHKTPRKGQEVSGISEVRPVLLAE